MLANMGCSYEIYFEQHDFWKALLFSLFCCSFVKMCVPTETRESETETETKRACSVPDYAAEVYVCVCMAYACKSFPQIIYDFRHFACLFNKTIPFIFLLI